MYDLVEFWRKALNKQADQTFYIHGRAITAFQMLYEGKLMWLLLCNTNSPDTPEAILSEEEYETFRYMNQDVPFMDY